MADMRNDNRNEEEQTAKKRSGGARRFLLFFLVLLAVLALVLLAAWRDGTGFDSLRRLFSYGDTETAAGEITYRYDASAQNRFAVVGDGLAVLSGNALQLLDKSGEEVWSASVRLAAPALDAGGNRAVAYDVGGTALYVLDSEGLVYEITADEAEPLIAANLNAKGWLAVTSDRKNLKGGVSVYNAEGREVFAFKSSERFVIDAYVTDDCSTLAAVTLGQEDGTFISNVVLYDLKEEEPKAKYPVTDGLVLAIGQQGDTLVTVSDTSLTFADDEGTVTASYAYNGMYLRGYDFGSEDFAVLQLNRYRSGSLGRLVTVAADGTEIASLDVRDEILSVSAAGRYIAVLYADKLAVYNRDLQEYAVLNGTGAAREALARADGTTVLLGADQAELYLP